jgi:hypothetical protein
MCRGADASSRGSRLKSMPDEAIDRNNRYSMGHQTNAGRSPCVIMREPMKGSASRGDRHSMSRLQSRYGNTIEIMNGRITSKLQQQQRLLRVYHGKAKDHAALTDLLDTILGQHEDCLERLTLRVAMCREMVVLLVIG